MTSPRASRAATSLRFFSLFSSSFIALLVSIKSALKVLTLYFSGTSVMLILFPHSPSVIFKLAGTKYLESIFESFLFMASA